MAYSKALRETFSSELDGIREAGLFKEERWIKSPQAADIEVEYPAGAECKKVINFCANNYLGLADHPSLAAAATDAMQTYGYGMASVRFICGTLDLHRTLEHEIATAAPPEMLPRVQTVTQALQVHPD